MVSRRAKGWLLVSGVAVVGAVVGVLAGFVLSDRIAGAVTGVVLAVLRVFSARGRVLVDRGTEVRSVLPDQVLGGRLQRVRELTDPVLPGVHPAAWDESGQVPTYVTRDVDDRVDEAVRAGGFVLLSGESTAGKTRIAYEAVRRVLPDHTWPHPRRVRVCGLWWRPSPTSGAALCGWTTSNGSSACMG